MAKKKKNQSDVGEVFLSQKAAMQQLITDTLETNYMPYAMSVIISRAIPEIDGFKPSQRKLLYTMYKMGLLNGGHRVKSTNVVGETMKLNPHGDSSIYGTLANMTRAYDGLLHPFIDSKGTFGKHYSTNMACSASRYTECRLEGICSEIFGGIDRDAVDFIPNYDNTMTEPKLLPTAFPNILVSGSDGIAVGLATTICSFNLRECCAATIEMLKNPSVDVDRILDIMPAPDFPGGAIILYNREEMAKIYLTGRGSFRMRSNYRYDPKENCIEILEIPDSTTIEPIMQKLDKLQKEGKLKEVSDFRDEIDLSGFKLTLDLRRGTDPDKLMLKLFKNTPLECTVNPNFNVILNEHPRLLGVMDIIAEWIKFRVNCVRRETTFELERKKEKLHLLEGLAKILLDIDKAIRIIRGTKAEADVVPNLMKGFDIDEIQADYVAEIKLRHINREYILNKIAETDLLRKDIERLEKIIGDDKLIKKEIISQLEAISKKYGRDRVSQIIAAHEAPVMEKEDEVENLNVRMVMTAGGYFKKLNIQTLRLTSTDNQTVKEGDFVILDEEGENLDELLFFSDKAQCYKQRASDFEMSKSSQMGDFVPVKLNFDNGERFLFLKRLKEYKESCKMIFIFANGKGVKVPISAYETKGNRSKLKNAYSDKSPIVAAFCEEKTPFDIVIYSSDGKCIQISTNLIPENSTRSSQGVTLFTLKKNTVVQKAVVFTDDMQFDRSPKKIKIPASGVSQG